MSGSCTSDERWELVESLSSLTELPVVATNSGRLAILFVLIIRSGNDAGNFLKHIRAIFLELFNRPPLNKGAEGFTNQFFPDKEVRGLPVICDNQSAIGKFDVKRCSR